MTTRPDFIAGNTRLRARLPALVGRAEYDRLARMPREAAIARLATTVYGPYLAAGEPDEVLLRAAVGRRLRDLLRGVRGCYVGTAGDVVGILLARHDLQDVLTLLRGARAGQPARQRLGAVLAVGAVGERAAADLAGADGPTTVLRLAAQQLPDPRTARALTPAWERYELTSDHVELETGIASTAIEGWTDRLSRLGRPALPVLQLVRTECDRANLVAVLRDPARDPRLCPAGLLTVPALLAARSGDHTEVVRARPSWRRALDLYAGHGDVLALEWALDVTTWRAAIRDVRRADPLGAAVPSGYVVAVECEARAVRMVLTGTPPPDLRDLLVA